MVAPTRITTSVAGSDFSTANVTSRSITPSTPIEVGEVVVVFAFAGGSTDMSMETISGNTWLSHGEREVTSGALGTITAWTLKAETQISSALTVNRTGSGGLAMLAFRLPSTYSAVPASVDNAGFNNSATEFHTTNAALTIPAGGGLALVGAMTNSGRDYSTKPPTGGTLAAEIASSGSGNPRVGGVAYNDAATGPVQPVLRPSINNAFAAIGMVLVEEAEEPDPEPIPGTLAIIGDSLTRWKAGTSGDTREADTRAKFVAAGWDTENIYWHGVGGKQLLVADSSGKTALQNIADAVTQFGGPPERMVIALGTNRGSLNESTFEAAVDTILDTCEAAGVGEVLWVNLAYWSPVNTGALTYNPILQDRVEARTWATYLDMNALMGDPRDAGDWIYPTDSTHLTAQGYAKRDDFIVAAIQNVRIGYGTGYVEWVGAATGSTVRTGAGSGTVTWVGSGSGSKTVAGTGVGNVTWVGQGTGHTDRAGSGSGSVVWVGSGSGHAPAVDGAAGFGSGQVTWVGQGTGYVTRAGSGAGSVVWQGSGVGSVQRIGTGQGAVQWTGTGTGTAPAVNAGEGSGSGHTQWTGTGVGSTNRTGYGTGHITWVGVAVTAGGSDNDTVVAVLKPRRYSGTLRDRRLAGTLR